MRERVSIRVQMGSSGMGDLVGGVYYSETWLKLGTPFGLG
jgi:hypothetical protein